MEKSIRFLSCLFLVCLFSCSNDSQKKGGDRLEEEGALLAKINCSSCHQYPEPKLLDKTTWKEHILPRMGYMMGVLSAKQLGVDFIEPAAMQAALANPMLFRSESTISKKEWEAIEQFYLNNAPNEPITANKPTITTELKQFEVKIPDIALSPPSTTMVKFTEQGFAVGDANSKRLYFFDQEMELQGAANAREGAVWLNELEDGFVATSMGSFSPTDQESGFTMFLPKSKNQKPLVLQDSLKRPVHTEIADLDGDGISDFVICEFAKWTGNLSWWKNDGKGNLKRNILKNMPGAIKAYIKDMNGDEQPDIVALFGQGDEGIFIFYNEGAGEFRAEQVLQFPPSYGSSYFNLFDYNGDEHPDLIYTNGDNADYPPIDKAYHGIRIFENDGNNQFEEVWFYPLQGAYSAIPNDFDQDGDLDIAAISFFPNFQTAPQESFVYLENQGNMQFNAQTFPKYNSGRWIVMDSGDLDKDGDTDLLLGSLTFEVVPAMGLVDKWVKAGIPFVLLENQLNE